MPAPGSSPAWMGRRNETTSPAEIITFVVFDDLGDVTSTWTGTDAVGATDSDPTGDHATGNNMVETSSSSYDADSDPLITIQYVGGSQPNVETQDGYDSRDRQVSVMSYNGTDYTYTYTTYDNLDEATKTQQFQAATAWTAAPSTDTLLSETDAGYDPLGEVYQTTQYAAISDNEAHPRRRPTTGTTATATRRPLKTPTRI